MESYAQIVTEVSVARVIEAVQRKSCGAVSVFVGTVRECSAGKRVCHLDFEVYEPMAVLELERISQDVAAAFSVQTVAVQHVKGRAFPGQGVVAIAVGAAHRKDSLQACTFLIEELKKRLPVWKKEYFADGSEWVGFHP